jgi:outer membrane protein assembly factor BamB
MSNFSNYRQIKFYRYCLFAGLTLFLSACTLFGDDSDELPSLPSWENQVTIHTEWKKTPVSGDVHEYTKFSPTIAGNEMILADDKGKLVVLDKKTGKTIWHKKEKYHFSSASCYADGKLYLGTDNAKVIAVNAMDGKVLWAQNLPNDVVGKPACAYQQKVVVKTLDGKLIALDEKTGHKLWQYDEGNPELILKGDSSPIVEDGKVITGFPNGKLLVVRLSDGSYVWDKQVADSQGFSSLARMVDVTVTPIVSQGVIYVGTYQGNISAISLLTGQTVWQHSISTYSGLSADDEHIFATDASGLLWAFDKKTGAVIWRQNALAQYMLTAPMVYKNYLLLGDNVGNLQIFSKKDGQPLGRIKVASHPIYVAPFIDHDTCYVLASDGKLSALNIGSSL